MVVGEGAGKLMTSEKKKIIIHNPHLKGIKTSCSRSHSSDSSSERGYKKTASMAHITGGGYYHYHLEHIGAADN